LSPFKDGKFSTGYKDWQNVRKGTTKFSGKNIEAISAHPLDKAERAVFIEIFPPKESAEKIIFRGGVSDSGICGSCSPVKVEIRQGQIQKTYFSRDGVWDSLELDGFLTTESIKLEITTERSGKRHFHFDVMYMVGIK